MELVGHQTFITTLIIPTENYGQMVFIFYYLRCIDIKVNMACFSGVELIGYWDLEAYYFIPQ